MAVPTLAELLDALTPDEIMAALLAKLQAGGFPTTDWSSGAPERTFTEAEAASQEPLWDLVASIAAGGHIDLATGRWLTWLAYNRYNLTRDVAVSTVGTIRLTCSASAGPYTITNNTLEFQGAGGNLYTNTAGAGVLASGGTLDVTVTARSPGADEGNDGADTIVLMTTPLPGVTCTNPATTFSTVTLAGTGTGTVTPTFGTASSASWVILITLSGQTGAAEFKLSSDGGLTYGTAQVTGGALVDVPDGSGAGSGLNLAFVNGGVNPSFVAGESYTFTSQGTWYTTQGADEESDATLRARCKAQWALLSSTPTDDAYTRMALDADSSVEKVRVYVDPVTVARVNIRVAGANGPIGSASTIAEIQEYIDARQAFTDDPVVTDAGTFPVTLAGGTVRVKAQHLATAQTAAQANVATYLGQCAIGNGSTVYIRHSQIVEAILRESGNEDDSVTGLTVNGSGTDVLITANAVATWSQRIATALTWTTY